MTRIALLTLIAGLLWLSPALSVAQNPVEDDTTLGWKKSAIVGLSITQSAYSNWKAGGDDSFAGKGGVDVNFQHFSEAFYQAHLFQVSFGQSWTDELGWRKIDDVLRYNYLIAYRTHEKWLPTFNLDFRTQLANGYNYDLADDGVKVSTFMAPGYLTETIGVAYEATDWLAALFGVAAKQTFVLDEQLRSPDEPSFTETNGYGNGPDESVRNELGFNLSARAEGEIAKNVVGRSELSVFAAFDDFGHPDVRWNNVIQLKVNDWLNTTIEGEIFYDNDQSSEVQWRELLSVGVAFNLL
jgi:hypothetical protein